MSLSVLVKSSFFLYSGSCWTDVLVFDTVLGGA